MSGYVRGPGVQHWHSIDTINAGPVAPQQGAFSTSVAWATANRAIFVPVIVRSPVVVRKLWFANTSTSATGNYDLGLYTPNGVALLRRGSTAKTADDAEEVWDCADTFLVPGLYYLALVSSTTVDTFGCSLLSAPVPTAYGCLAEESALPLPATATFAISDTLTFVPTLGMLLTTVVS